MAQSTAGVVRDDETLDATEIARRFGVNQARTIIDAFEEHGLPSVRLWRGTALYSGYHIRLVVENQARRGQQGE